MKHYVQNGFRTPTEAGLMLDEIYGWHMSDDQQLVYDDDEKTLIMYDTLTGNEEWRSDNYDIHADMHSYLQHL